MTIDLSNYSHYIFCQNDDKQTIDELNKEIVHSCDSECLQSCQEIMFLASYLATLMGTSSISVPFEESFYYVIKYIPKLIFSQLIINMVNVFNTWHGISIAQILVFITILANKSTKLKLFIEKVVNLQNTGHLMERLKTKLKVSFIQG